MDKNQPSSRKNRMEAKGDADIEILKIKRRSYSAKFKADQKERENKRMQELELVKDQLQAAHIKIRELEVEIQAREQTKQQMKKQYEALERENKIRRKQMDILFEDLTELYKDVNWKTIAREMEKVITRQSPGESSSAE